MQETVSSLESGYLGDTELLDEYQLQVCKTLVEAMYFDSEEEARKYINDNLEDKRMADITHINDKFVTGYSEVGELMALGIKEAAEFYNMKVEFDGDYQLGFCWKDCH